VLTDALCWMAALSLAGVLGCDRGGPPRSPADAADAPARATCASRSAAPFPGAFTNPANLVAGPLVLVGARGARYAHPDLIRRFGGVKSPVLVRAGHTVTVRIVRGAQHSRLDYHAGATAGHPAFRSLPRSVRFVACRDDERSGSNVDGRPVTFWSGFIALSRAPACVLLEITADGAPPREVPLAFGRRSCPGA